MALSTPFFLCKLGPCTSCTYYTQLIFKSPQKESANKKNKNEIWFDTNLKYVLNAQFNESKSSQ